MKTTFTLKYKNNKLNCVVNFLVWTNGQRPEKKLTKCSKT